MKHKNVTQGVFISRENRFCATVSVDGKNETVHVKNTGRLKELLVSGACVYLSKSDNASRKTRYDLVAVQKGKRIVSIDSQAANTIAHEWICAKGYFGKDAAVRREVTFGKSRFDFYIESGERKIFLEVKGCTLEKDGRALFPDAPTERGIKHIKELVECKNHGFEAYILFIIQMKGTDCFSPNDDTHPDFGAALRDAAKSGVNILALDCNVLPDEVTADDFVKIIL
ncbi:MAG: DNA/RNA nuclease SfsA [Ruminococcaceae bacterium]|nr:DNA/RNA nuclease SfsA [Oscillospiraceae bacterium]